MKISLITACRRSEGVIRTALESVLAQRDVGLEYLVIDGGSDDGTVEIVKEYEPKFGGRMHWVSERDEGMYDAINKGIRMATGDVVGILNADDYLDGSDVLAQIADVFEQAGNGDADGERLDCVFGNVRFVKEPGGRTQRVCFARFWCPWMLHWGYMPPHPAIFIRRERFADWGGYVPSRAEYRIAADYELLVRFFCRHGMSYRYVPLCTTAMRLGGVSTRDVEARKKLNEEIVKANRANGYACWWPMLLPKYAIKIWEVILPKIGLMK